MLTVREVYEEFEGVRYYRIPSGYYKSNGSNGRKRLHRVIWESHNGPIPDGHVVHHIDGDKSNNSIENLMLMDDTEHKRLHQGTPEAIKRKRLYASNMVAWTRTLEGRRCLSERAKRTRARDPIKTYICLECGEEFQAKAPNGAIFCSPKCRTRDMRRRKREVAA